MTTDCPRISSAFSAVIPVTVAMWHSFLADYDGSSAAVRDCVRPIGRWSRGIDVLESDGFVVEFEDHVVV